LRQKKGNEAVIAADIKSECPSLLIDGPYHRLDIMNREEVRSFVQNNAIDEVYLLAALLSATAEKKSRLCLATKHGGIIHDSGPREGRIP